jgi:phage baseplate assembly protein W
MFDLKSGATDIEGFTTSINRCIGLLLTTGKGELLGDPDFGCRLYELLFEQYSAPLEADIKKEISDSIKKFESRVSINPSDITITPVEDPDKNKYMITIKYDIAGTTRSGSLSFAMEGRDN